MCRSIWKIARLNLREGLVTYIVMAMIGMTSLVQQIIQYFMSQGGHDFTNNIDILPTAKAGGFWVQTTSACKSRSYNV